MYDIYLKKLSKLIEPVEIIVIGSGFMGFGFVSNAMRMPGIRVPLIISRRPKETVEFLTEKAVKAKLEDDPEKIKENIQTGFISVSDDLSLIESYKQAQIVFEVTGTVDYGTKVALKALNAGKHLITMNPELQVTVGTKLKQIADQKGVVITDVYGDQPGSLTRLVSEAKFMGFKVLIAGNMKRYLDIYATQEKMKPWADDKGLAVRQTTSFTDGTKQAIEMNLVANYYGMKIIERGMKGPVVEDIKEVLNHFDFENIPEEGIVDYAIGKNLFPGIFVVVKHSDPNQQKYLRYLGLGEGPYYILFEPYHLCHLEVMQTIAKVVFFNEPTINNGHSPRLATVAVAKKDLKKGEKLDGIGGDTVYGVIESIENSEELLPIGITQGAVLQVDIPKDSTVKLKDVHLPANDATALLGL